MSIQARAVIFGKRSNLTKSLVQLIPAHIFSTKDVLLHGFSVETVSGLPVVINSFQPAEQIGNLSNLAAYIDRSFGVLARILEVCRMSNPSRIIYTSSAAVYGENSDCCESDLVQIRNVHAAFKVASERLVLEVVESMGTECTIMRPFNLFGGVDSFSVVHKITEAATSLKPFVLANYGASVRDFTHVDDAARAYATVIRDGGPQVLNVARGVPVKIGDLAQVVRDQALDLQLIHEQKVETAYCVANVDLLKQYIDVDSFIDPQTFIARQLASS